ncbi:alpha 1,3-glucosidase [Capronia coronata CBS 617.96]|uniref:Alpha 1,3-glucosidase n=1 Tax=Capronia coronata CBS 617.96 TaxID=1182541 RepID=W9YV23_9EURO|nr:alpha 1,3-glucosidase [Capronia coronata CBS 617.96]EXJ93530.1 alpha 1,3-glucosidase [Capronia coronata CBS 617.96]
MLGLLTVVVDYFAPLFLVASPVTSYADQIASIHRKKSSDGFSLDIPLIMLVASILKVFYWFGAYYDKALLLQAALMIVVQLILLKVALDNRAPTGARDGPEHTPFHGYTAEDGLRDLLSGRRPYDFWQWSNPKSYFQFLGYFASGLLVIHVLLPFVSRSPAYISFLGYFGLTVEAILPVPQIIQNHRARSCKGFRLSVIANWLAGDAMKMSYFFLSSEYVPWPFRLCGMFQACCDCYLGFQYYMYGEGPVGVDIPMSTTGKPGLFG